MKAATGIFNLSLCLAASAVFFACEEKSHRARDIMEQNMSYSGSSTQQENQDCPDTENEEDCKANENSANPDTGENH